MKLLVPIDPWNFSYWQTHEATLTDRPMKLILLTVKWIYSYWQPDDKSFTGCQLKLLLLTDPWNYSVSPMRPPFSLLQTHIRQIKLLFLVVRWNYFLQLSGETTLAAAAVPNPHGREPWMDPVPANRRTARTTVHGLVSLDSIHSLVGSTTVYFKLYHAFRKCCIK